MHKIFNLLLLLFIFLSPSRDLLAEQFGFNFVSFIGVITTLFFFMALISKSIKLNGKIFVFITVIFSYLIFSSLLNHYRGYDLNQTYLFSDFQYLILISMVFTYVKNTKDYNRVLYSISLGIFFLSLFAIYDFNFNIDYANYIGSTNFRASGGLRNPSFLALYSLTNFFLILYFFENRVLKKYNYLLFIPLIISLITLAISFMRSAYLVFVILFLLKVIFSNVFSKISTVLYLAIVLIISLFAIQKFGFDELFIERLSFIQNIYEGVDSSTNKRAIVMSGALYIFMENILFGIGPGNLSTELVNQGYILFARSAENTFLHFLNNYGFTLIIIIILLITFLFKDEDKVKINNGFVFLAIIATSMFDNNLNESILYIFSALYLSSYNLKIAQ